MAKLPDYTALGGRPEPQAELNVTPYDETLAAPARALQQLGATLGHAANDMSKMYREEERKNAIIRAEDDHNKIKTWMLDKQYGEKGYTKTAVGEAAVKTPWINTNIQEYDAYSNELLSSATDGDHKNHLKQVISNERYRLLSDMTKHQVVEEERYKDAVYSGLISTSTASAIRDTSSAFNIVMSERERIREATKVRMNDKGLKDEATVTAAVNKHLSDLNIAVINQALADNNPKRAEEYFNMVVRESDGTVRKIKDEIDPTKLGDVTKQINKYSELSEAQNVYEDMIAKGFSDEKKYKIARDKYEGSFQEELLKQIDHGITRDKAAQRLSEKTAQNDVYRIYSETNDLTKIPPFLQEQMGYVAWQRLVTTDLARKRAAANGKSIPNDPVHYAEIMTMAIDNPADFMQLVNSGGLQSYQLNGKTVEKFIGMAANKKDLTESKAIRDETNKALVDMGIKDPNKNRLKNNSKGEEIRAFDKRVYEWAFDTKERTGVWPAANEYKKFISDQKIKVVKEGWFFDSEKPIGRMEIEGVPSAEAARIAEYLKKVKPKYKGDVTEDDIKTFYNSSIGIK